MNTSPEFRGQLVRAIRIVAFALAALVLLALVMSVFHRAWRGAPTSFSYRMMMDDDARFQGGGETAREPFAMMKDQSNAPFVSPRQSEPTSTMMGFANGMMDEGERMMTGDDEPSFSNATAEKVIRNGNVSLRVESAEDAMMRLRQIVSELGGSVQSSSIFTDERAGTKSGEVVLRVPVQRFDDALEKVRGIARAVLSETTNGQDVSAEAVDLQVRLKNKQAEEQSISAILTRDSNKIADVLAVTRELARVRGEIEQLQAQINFLNDQAAQSTITVSLEEDAKVGVSGSVWRPSQEVKDALNALLAAGRKALSFLISFFIVVLPVAVLVIAIFGGIAWILIRKLLGRLRK